MKIACLCLLLAVPAFNCIAQDSTSVSVDTSGLPLVFEPNRGQAPREGAFLTRVADGMLLLSARGVTLLPSAPKDDPNAAQEPALQLELVNSSPDKQLRGVRELPGKSNYFIGSDPSNWHTNVPQFGAVEYRSAFPGVDLVFYGNQQDLEYDYHLAAFADPGLIQMRVERGQLELDKSGDLHVHVGAPDLAPATLLRDGVTSMVDGGSAGADNIDQLVRVAEQAPNRVRIFLNIARTGVTGRSARDSSGGGRLGLPVLRRGRHHAAVDQPARRVLCRPRRGHPGRDGHRPPVAHGHHPRQSALRPGVDRRAHRRSDRRRVPVGAPRPCERYCQSGLGRLTRLVSPRRWLAVRSGPAVRAGGGSGLRVRRADDRGRLAGRGTRPIAVRTRLAP